jgi:catechol 2,3-dioxygenase-like lactoylglutathione lyase family enzyme
MIDHITVYVNDIEESKLFYSAALKPLGFMLTGEMPEWKLVSFGLKNKPFLWVYAKEGGATQQAHLAFAAKDASAVKAFHKAALKAGGKDNGAPGYRKNYNPGYYAAFITDPSGHNIEAVYHDKSKMVKAKPKAKAKPVAKAKPKAKPKKK